MIYFGFDDIHKIFTKLFAKKHHGGGGTGSKKSEICVLAILGACQIFSLRILELTNLFLKASTRGPIAIYAETVDTIFMKVKLKT